MANRAKRSYTFWWFFQRFTAVILVFTLIYHMVGMHFSFDGGVHRSELDAAKIIEHFNSPYFKAMYLLFLFSGLTHGLNGLMNVVDDYVSCSCWKTAWVWFIWLLGIGIFILGAVTALS